MSSTQSPSSELSELDQARLRARADLLWLARTVLGFKEMTDAVHGPMANLFLKKDPSIPLYELDTLKRRMLLAPRGTFKTCMDQADIVQLILCYPDIRILIITGTQDLAIKMVAELKAMFQSLRMQQLFPEFAPPPSTKRWGDDEGFTVLNRVAVRREPTISISTIASVKAGSHYEVIKVDDAVNEVNSLNEFQCEKVCNAIDALTPLLEPEGFLDLIGTRYDKLDAYGLALQREIDAAKEAEEDEDADYDGPELKTCIMAAWTVHEDHVPLMDASGRQVLKARDVTLLFPSRHKFKFLYKIFRKNPRQFHNQYLNNCDSAAMDANFDMAVFERHIIPHSQIPDVGETYLSFDLAGTVLKKDSDYCACTVGKLGIDGRLRIVDIIHQRLNSNGQSAWIVEMNLKWNPVRVYIEASAGAQYLEYAIRDIAAQHGTYVSISWVTPSRMQGSKESRIAYIPSLMLLDSLWISASCQHLQDLKEEAEDFPSSKYDDLLDSLAQLCLALKPGGITPGPTKEELQALHDKLRQEAFWNQMFGPGGEPLPPAAAAEPVQAGRCGYGLNS